MENFEDVREERDRLQRLVLSLAERLAAASEVLSILAERKDRRNQGWQKEDEDGRPTRRH